MRNLVDWNQSGVIQRQKARTQTADYMRLRGTRAIPDPPRGVFVQSASRGFLISWNLPVRFDDIVGWRICKGDEKSLYQEIRDRGIRQKFIEATSGTTPPVINIFVSSVNALGVESSRVQSQGASTAETGAPAIPQATTASTGSNTSSSYQPKYNSNPTRNPNERNNNF